MVSPFFCTTVTLNQTLGQFECILAKCFLFITWSPLMCDIRQSYSSNKKLRPTQESVTLNNFSHMLNIYCSKYSTNGQFTVFIKFYSTFYWNDFNRKLKTQFSKHGTIKKNEKKNITVLPPKSDTRQSSKSIVLWYICDRWFFYNVYVYLLLLFFGGNRSIEVTLREGALYNTGVFFVQWNTSHSQWPKNKIITKKYHNTEKLYHLKLCHWSISYISSS